MSWIFTAMNAAYAAVAIGFAVDAHRARKSSEASLAEIKATKARLDAAFGKQSTDGSPQR